MINVAVKKAIKIAGSQESLGKAIGRSQSLIHSWLYGQKKVSVSSVPDIVEFTKGAVKAHELRPDLPKVFPHPKGSSHTPNTQHEVE